MNQTCPDCFPQFLKINEYSIISMIYVQLVVVQQKRNLHNVQRTKPFHGKKCWIEISIINKIPLNLVSKEITMYLCFSKKMWGFCFDWVKQKYNICKSLIFFGIFFLQIFTPVPCFSPSLCPNHWAQYYTQTDRHWAGDLIFQSQPLFFHHHTFLQIPIKRRNGIFFIC